MSALPACQCQHRSGTTSLPQRKKSLTAVLGSTFACYHALSTLFTFGRLCECTISTCALYTRLSKLYSNKSTYLNHAIAHLTSTADKIGRAPKFIRLKLLHQLVHQDEQIRDVDIFNDADAIRIPDLPLLIGPLPSLQIISDQSRSRPRGDRKDPPDIGSVPCPQA